MKPRVLDLFSGIGGFSLGLERAGMETAAFCEIDPFCRRVLAKHWPEVPCYDDITALNADRLSADGVAIDLMCGGFPCQDLSRAGQAAGINGERSGLWKHYIRLIDEVRPRVVVMENVTELLGRGFGDLLGALALLGYDAEWHRIPASAVGAPHPRERVWLMAHRDPVFPIGTFSAALGQQLAGRWSSFGQLGASSRWDAEPDICRVVDGVPADVDRLRVGALGNSVVSLIPEIIGRALMQTVFTPPP